jgi:hypothetical protein
MAASPGNLYASVGACTALLAALFCVVAVIFG